jgi:hypothetical protein
MYILYIHKKTNIHFVKFFQLTEAILKGYENGVYHSGLMSLWILSIIWYSKEHNISESGSVSFLR